MSESTAIALRSSTDLAQIAELEEILLGNAEVPADVVEDPEVVAREIVARILAAESDAELEQFGGAIGWRDLEGVPIRIKNFRWRPSTFEQGAPVFFVVQGFRLDTGEAVVLTTGSLNVLAQLANMAKRGTLVDAVRCLVQSEKPTKAGYHPLWLVTPEDEVEAA